MCLVRNSSAVLGEMTLMGDPPSKAAEVNESPWEIERIGTDRSDRDNWTDLMASSVNRPDRTPCSESLEK